MRILLLVMGLILLLAVVFSFERGEPAAPRDQNPDTSSAEKWVSAYYAGWMQGHLPIAAIDFSAITHLMHFSIYPNGGSKIDGTLNGINRESSLAVTAAAHAAGKKAIITVGGWGADKAFDEATNNANRDQFITNLVSYMASNGYDGIDIDWEPVTSPAQFRKFIPDLRAAMKRANPHALLMTAVFSYDVSVVEMHKYFDQVNLMTYDMAGPWDGWVTWHTAPLSNGGNRFPSTDGLLPSVEMSVDQYKKSGVPAKKLGIGITFYGYVWKGGSGTVNGGVTDPTQAWINPPTVQGNIPFFTIVESYGKYPLRWDEKAKASFYSIDAEADVDDKFISLESERSIFEKFEFIRREGLGGAIVYEIGAGYQPKGARQDLLNAVKRARAGESLPATPSRDEIPPVVDFITPLKGDTISGQTNIAVRATDDQGIAGVSFVVDEVRLGNEIFAPPFSITIDTWRIRSGRHKITATARDMAGNKGSSSIEVTIVRKGMPPAYPELLVYLDDLRSPFINTSWSATVDFENKEVVRSGNVSARVQYMANGAFDLMSGTWGAEVPISTYEYSALVFDIFPTSEFSLTVGFYNDFTRKIRLRPQRWNSVSVSLDFKGTFTRFYLQREEGGNAVAYLDNIRFVPKGPQ